ncbi:hypothetical protein [Desulfofustis glycolicus]|uniref:hypothetical protein n=1 Tax=Desulfofustis glycolicus TaxID=51195 RepID=UPI001FCA247F|nr:hypothetical protein [Desulfofustis glycolicus]
MMAEYKHRPLAVDDRQAFFDPSANCVLVDAEQPRHLFHRIVAVNFNQAMILVSLPHYSEPPSGLL